LVFLGLGARQLGEFLQEQAQRVGGGVVAGDYGVLPGWSRDCNAVIELVGDSGFAEQLLGQGSEIHLLEQRFQWVGDLFGHTVQVKGSGKVDVGKAARALEVNLHHRTSLTGRRGADQVQQAFQAGRDGVGTDGFCVDANRRPAMLDGLLFQAARAIFLTGGLESL
jgi:hypothetical protein